METSKSTKRSYTNEASDAMTKKRMAAAAILKKIGDETDARKFPHLIKEWQEDCETEAIGEEETLYSRLVKQATDYIRSWTFLEAIYVPRTDNFLNNSSYS